MTINLPTPREAYPDGSGPPTSYVTVLRRDWSTSTIAGVRIVIEGGDLYLHSRTTGQDLALYPRGTWREAEEISLTTGDRIVRVEMEVA